MDCDKVKCPLMLVCLFMLLAVVWGSFMIVKANLTNVDRCSIWFDTAGKGVVKWEILT